MLCIPPCHVDSIVLHFYQVSNLELQTKNYDKDSTSLQNTNARLALTKRRIREAKLSFAKLQGDYSKLEQERDMLRDRTNEATTAACKVNANKKSILEHQMMNQKQNNSIMERHLRHIIHSAGLDEDKASMLLRNIDEFIQENEKELERLELAIAGAKKKYDRTLETRREELRRLGVAEAELLKLDALGVSNKE